MSTRRIDIRKLTREQRLRLLEEIWESLSPDRTSPPPTEAQRQELDRRLDEIDRDGGHGIPWDEVLAKFRTAQ